MSGDHFKMRLNSHCTLSHHALTPPDSHLLVLALLGGELLQDAALPDARELLPQGALAGRGHGAAPGCPISRVTGRPVHREVHACLTDVATDRLASDLLGDDGGAVRLVQRL